MRLAYFPNCRESEACFLLSTVSRVRISGDSDEPMTVQTSADGLTFEDQMALVLPCEVNVADLPPGHNHLRVVGEAKPEMRYVFVEPTEYVSKQGPKIEASKEPPKPVMPKPATPTPQTKAVLTPTEPPPNVKKGPSGSGIYDS